MLKNRRKRIYGELDGNPLSIEHFRSLDPTISGGELNELVDKGILKTVEYSYLVKKHKKNDLVAEEKELLGYAKENKIIVDELKVIRALKIKRIPISSTIESLKSKNVEGVVLVAPTMYPHKEKFYGMAKFGKTSFGRFFSSKAMYVASLEKVDHQTSIISDNGTAIDTAEIEMKFINGIIENQPIFTRSRKLRD